jgi:hypothetical protein
MTNAIWVLRPQPSPNEKSRNLAAERASLLPDSLKNRDNEDSTGNRRSRGLGSGGGFSCEIGRTPN